MAFTLAGTTSAAVSELNNQSVELMSSNTIGSGVCQTFLGNNIYDLKKFDEMHRDIYWNTPAVIQTQDASSAFMYKTCDPSWKMTEEMLKHTSLKDSIYENMGF